MAKCNHMASLPFKGLTVVSWHVCRCVWGCESFCVIYTLKWCKRWQLTGIPRGFTMELS